MCCLIMLFFGLKMFFMMKNHLLMLLLSLEFMSLVILMTMINMISMFSYDLSLVVYLIIIMVCEAVMGLVLLTLVVRTHGSDYIKMSSVFMC